MSILILQHYVTLLYVRLSIKKKSNIGSVNPLTSSVLNYCPVCPCVASLCCPGSRSAGRHGSRGSARHSRSALQASTDQHGARAKPLFADGGGPSCQLNPAACFDSRAALPEAQVIAAGVGRSLCFGRGSQGLSPP